MDSLSKTNSTTIRLADHFSYHKFYGQFRLQSLMGLSIDPKPIIYIWNHAAEELTQEFARTMDFILRGGCNKKNTIKKLAIFHQNFDLPEDLVLYVADKFMRSSVADICDEADLAAFDNIFITDLARTGLLEGSKPGYLENGQSAMPK